VSPCCAFNRTYGGVAALGIDDHRRIQGEPHAVTYSSLLALEYILCIAGGIQIQPGWAYAGRSPKWVDLSAGEKYNYADNLNFLHSRCMI